jgi:hypothetical protein
MPLKHNTWTGFYREKRDEGGAFGDVFLERMTIFNETTLSHLNDPNSLKLSVVSNTFNFLLIPGPDKTIQLVHNIMLVPQEIGKDPVMICTQGNRSTSPFQAIPYSLICSSVRNRRGTDKTNLKWTWPTMEQFLQTSSEQEFEELQAKKGTKITDESDFTSIPRHLFVHPLVFLTLDGRGACSAKEAGTKLVLRIQELQSSNGDPEEAEEIMDFTNSAHLLLGFLWAVSRGQMPQTPLGHPPELDSVDEVCNLVLRRIREESEPTSPKKAKTKSPRRSTSRSGSRGRSTSNSSPRQRSPGESSSDDSQPRTPRKKKRHDEDLGGLTAALVQNMNELAASHLEVKRKEAKKSSMMNLMGAETEHLFKVLSAKGWSDRDPKLNPFMELLVRDKGMSRASELVRSEMRRGEGSVTDNGLIQFLSGGYLCKTMDERPGGFTFFMFRPTHISGGHNPRLLEQSIRETFGDAKLSEETVKFYAKGNYFLPSSFPDFMIQLEACFRTLELFTARRGIASKGYRLAHRLIQEQSVRYRPLFVADPTLGIKIGRFLDNVFQNFCSDLAEYVFDKDPVRASRRKLEYRFEDQVQSFFNGIRNGVVPSILLPESLTPNSSITGEDFSTGTGTSKAKAQGKGKVEKNPEIKVCWKIPAGKKFGDFFSPGRTDLKANVSGWPKFPHRTARTERPMCLRFQTAGECTKNCTNSHILPSEMPTKTWDEVRARMMKIIGG